MTLTGGELLLNLLENYGVESIFCSPGTEWAPVWEALAKRNAEAKAGGAPALRYINCRHEMLAVSMAMGYAEVTGKLPAVLLHSGIGTLHGSMALRNAYFAKVPMIVFSGETYEHTGDAEIKPQGWHWLGLLSDIGGPSSFVKGYVKWSNSVKSKDGLIDLVSRGCQIARATPQGPVFLSLSPELLIRTYQECPLSRPYPVESVSPPHASGIEEAARRLMLSKEPVIISEYAGRTPGAVDQLIQLAETLSIPVFEGTYPVRANFPRSNPLYMGFDAADALQQADTIMVVGGSAPWYPPLSCKAGVDVILLDDDPLHANLPHWGYPVDLTLTGAIDQGLASMVDLIRTRIAKEGYSFPPHRERLARWQARHDSMVRGWETEAAAGMKSMPISVKWFLHEARRVLPHDAMILDETITHMRPILQYMAEPGHFIKAGYGCLGVGIGEALGVKMAFPEAPVVLFIGDGAFSYNPVLAGLGLCQEYSLPILIVIMNNGGYVGMKWALDSLYPDGYSAATNTFLGVNITPAPNYAGLATVFDGYGEKLEIPENIEKTLTRGLKEVEKGKTVVLDVIL